MKKVKILFLVVFSLFALILTSCVPGGGTQPAQGWAGTVFHDGTLYVGSTDGRVVAVNPLTQNIEWSYAIAASSSSSGIMSCGQTSVPTAIYGTSAVDGDLVYIGTYDGKVLSLSTSARSQDLPFPQKRSGEWKWICSGGIVGSSVVDGDAVYITSSNGRVYSLDKEFGDLNWESDILDEKLWTTLVIRGDTIYVSTFDGHIYTLSTETGKKLPWTFKSDVGFISSPMLYDNSIFVGSFDNKLYVIKVGDDEPKWEFSGGRWFWAAPVVEDGVVYAGCLDGKVYAIDADSGRELWEFDAGGPIVASPILVDDSLVVAAESGNVYVINSKTGIGERIKNPEGDNKPSIGAPVRATLCAHEGTVYIHAQDNCLYTLDIGEERISWRLPLAIKQES